MEEGFTITGNRDRLSFDRKDWKKKNLPQDWEIKK